MKKIKLLILSLFLPIFIFALTSCGGGRVQQGHTHSFSHEYKSDDVYHWHECECGEVSDKAEHQFDLNFAEDGTRIKICVYCNHKVVDDHTHDYDETWQFDESGHWHVAICCPGQKGQTYPHNYERYEEIDNGEIYDSQICNDCGFILRGRKHQHEYRYEFDFDENYHWHSALCGHEDAVKKEEHKFNPYQEVIEEDGYLVIYESEICYDCGYIKHGYHNHSFSDVLKSNETHHWYPSTCGHENLTKDYNEHDFSDWVVTTEPTEHYLGFRERTCRTCNYYVEETLPMLEHVHIFSDSLSYNETHHYYESICGHDVVKDEEEHIYGEWIVDIEPTEESIGHKYRQCLYCPCYDYEEIPMLEHVHKFDGPWYKDEWGHYMYATCHSDVRSEVYTHNYIISSITEVPTLSKQGHFIGRCSVCAFEDDYHSTFVMPIINDTDYKVVSIVKPSTCTEIGVAVYEYTYNDYTVSFEGELKCIDHNFVSGVCSECNLGRVSLGLEYMLMQNDSLNMKEYYVSGIGTCTDTELIIPKEYNGLPVTGIDKYAFSGCTQLTSVVIPAGLKIFTHAFSGCYNIEEISLPNGEIKVPVLGAYETNLYYAQSYVYAPVGYLFGYTEYENAYKIEQYIKDERIGTSGIAYIPNALKTIRFTGDVKLSDSFDTVDTGLNALEDFESIETVYLAENFETISNSTFINCKNLSSINLKDTKVKTYGPYAFYGCEKLTSDLLLFEGLEYIGREAFFACPLDKDLVLPTTVSKIELAGLKGLGHIETITLSNFGTHEYSHFAYLFGDQNYTDAKSVPENLKSITVRDAMVFTKYAFNDIEKLEELNLNPDSTILENAISGCGVKFYTKYENAYYLGAEDSPHHWLMYVIDLTQTEFTIAEDCKKIVGGAFHSYNYDNNISELVIPESVVEIGFGALNGMSSLTTLTIPFIGGQLGSQLEYEKEYNSLDFGYIFGTRGYDNSYGVIDHKLTEGNCEYRIPSSLTKVHSIIGNYSMLCFADMTSLEEIKISKVYEGANNSYAFEGCSNLKTLYIDRIGLLGYAFSFSEFDNSYKVTQSFWNKYQNMMDYETFYAPLSLTDLYIMSGDIADYAFEDFESIKNITLSGGTNISNTAFRGCNLETVTILDTYEEIPNDAFKGMKNLKTVNLHEGLTRIGNYAFAGCSSLENINLHENLESIGEYAFTNCESLESINTLGKVTVINPYTFSHCTNLRNIDLSNINKIYEYAFYDSGIEEIKINHLTQLSYNDAFLDCPNVTNIEIGYDANLLTYHIFKGKQNLKTVKLSGTGDFEIPASMFEDCVSLETVEFLFNVTAVGNYAFKGCSSIKELHLSNTITSIGVGVLEGTTSLEKLTIPFVGNNDDVTHFGYLFGIDTYENQNDVVPESLKEVVVSGNVVIKENSFNGLTNLTHLDLSNASLIERNSLVGCDNLVYLAVSNIAVKYERTPLGSLFGCTSFNSNSDYVPESLKEVRVSNTEKIYQNLFHSLVLDTVYISNDATYIYNAFSSGTTDTKVSNVYFEGTIEEWLNVTINSEGNPAKCSDHFYVLDENNNYYEPTSLTLSQEDVGSEASYFKQVKELVIEKTVTRIATVLGLYELDKVYYNGSLADWLKITIEYENNNPLAQAKEFYYKDSNDNYVLFDGHFIIPEGVTEVNKNSLHINGLTKVSFPSTIEKFDIKSIKDLSILEYNEYGNCLYLGNENNPYIILVKAINTDITSALIHENTRIILSNAFLDTKVTELVVPDGVKQIGDWAFSTDTLESITLPLTNTLEESENGNNTFTKFFINENYGRIPNNLTKIVVTSAKYLNRYYFNKCQNINDVTLPEGVQYHKESIYYFNINTNEYKNGYYIAGPNTPYMILFKGIDNTQTKFEVHEDTSMYEQGALNGFTSLEELYLNVAPNMIGDLFVNHHSTNTSNSSVPSTLKTVKITCGEVDSYTFKSMSLDNLYFTSDCYAELDFGGFTSLTNGYFDGTVEDWCKFNFTKDKQSPLYYAQNMYIVNEEGTYDVWDKVVIPSSVTVLNKNLFKNFKSLKEIVITHADLTLGEGVFANCTNVETVSIPTIGSNTFLQYFGYLFGDYRRDGNTNIPTTLKNLVLTGNIEGLSSDYEVLFNTNKIENIYLTKDVTTIQAGLDRLYNLKNVYYEGTLSDWMNISFLSSKANPTGPAEHLYLLNEENEYEEITVLDLRNCNYVGDYVFYSLNNLEKVIVNGYLNSNGKAFLGCFNTTVLEVVNGFSSAIDNLFNSDIKIDTLIISDESYLETIPYYKYLTNLYLPNTLSTISDTAFSNYEVIENIYFDGTVEDWCQLYFSSLEQNPITYANNFYLRNSDGEYEKLTKLELSCNANSYQFAGLKNLEEVVILEGGNLYSSALFGCDNIKNMTLNLSSTSINYLFKNNLNEGTVPELESLTAIGSGISQSAFTGLTIKDLYISSSVTEIKADAFLDSNIENVYFDGNINNWLNVSLYSINSTPSLHVSNFYIRNEENEYDNEITKVEITSGAGYHFVGLESLEEVIMHENASLSTSGLYGCTNIKNLTINLSYFSLDDYFKFNGSGSVPTLENLILVGKRVYKEVFKNKSISKLTLSNSIKEFDKDAFLNASIENCYYDGTVADWTLIDIKYADSNPMMASNNFYFKDNGVDYEVVNTIEISTEIGMFQFAGLKSLEEVIVLEGGSLYQYCLYNCENLKHLTFSPNQQAFKIYFTSNAGLGSVPEFETLTLTGESVYDYCLGGYRFKNVYISKSINYIGKSAFSGSSIENLYFDGTLDEWFGVGFGDATASPVIAANNFYVKNTEGEYELISEINISTSVDTIKSYQFAGYKFETLEIPANIKTIEANAFYGCSEITELVIPETVTYIGASAFGGCNKLQKITVPFVGLEAQPEKAEHQRLVQIFGTVPTSLKEVVISSGTQVPQNAFYKCPNIEKVVISDGIETIRNQAFSNMTALKEVVIPESVKDVQTYAFFKCTSLEEISIPSGATVGENAFQHCKNIKKLTLPTVNPQTVTEYVENKNSNNFDDIMYYFDTYTTSTYTEYLTNLTELTVSGDGTSSLVSANAFTGLTSLTTVKLENLISVGKNAFKNCTNITSLELNNINKIDSYAFENCIGLTSLDLSGVKEILNLSFLACNNVKDIVIGYVKGSYKMLYIYFGGGSDAYRDLNSVTILNTDEDNYAPIQLMYLNIENVYYEEGIDNTAVRACGNANITNLYLPVSLKYVSTCVVGDNTNVTNLYYAGNLNDWQSVSIGYTPLETCVTNLYLTENGEYVSSTSYNELLYIDKLETLSENLFTMFPNIREVVFGIQLTRFYETTFNFDNMTIYYEGNSEDWKNVMGRSYIGNAKLYFYSEETPVEEGNYWYRNTNNNICIW